MGDEDAERREANRAFVEAFSTFGTDALRDVWLFDQQSHERLYVRDDVDEKVADVDVSRYVDNERYGYVTRDTYSDLHYADYAYTVRGFDGFEQFRTFLREGDRRIGTFGSFDRREGGYDFGALNDALAEVTADYPLDAFAPE
ncbi:hypothetical protein M0R88_16020 [Halorussus gelatinilyticus]|uniref:Uncharacterized protein n=1 Tax=Halorussus gelatinilyticus TaxID=2937524 RepID=A0A8U0IGJ8_9EURY|nr:hypothetical protein [Halorussus gelatinilyticus]UPW00008.1 hypothetical protein M0R88_16020 [Halorussus gelatinilyticus]